MTDPKPVAAAPRTPRFVRNGNRVTWLCAACGEPVRARTGYLTLDQRVAWVRERAWVEYKRQCILDNPSNELRVRAVSEMPSEKVARWDAWHRNCDPRPDSADYWFAVERADTVGKLLHWTAHLAEKEWVGHSDWFTLMLTIGTDA